MRSFKSPFGKIISVLSVLPILIYSPTRAESASPAEKKVLSQEEIEKLLKNEPHSYRAHLEAGRFYQKKGFVVEAENEYKLAINAPNAGADAYKQLANLLLRSHDYDQAEKISLEAKKKFQTDYSVLLTCGYVLHNCHKLDDALAVYEKARSLKPGESDIYLAIGDVLQAQNKPKEALAMVEKGIKLGACDKEFAAFEKAKILVALDRFSEAVHEMDPVFEKYPFSSNTNDVYLAALLKCGNLEKALEVRLCLLSKANGRDMQINKSEVGGLCSKLSKNQIDLCIARAEKRIADQKLKARLHFAMGDIYDRAKNSGEAIQQYEAGLKLDPTFARGYLRLAEDQEVFLKDFKSALKNYETAQKLDKADKEINLRLNNLRQKQGIK